jgi:hypothetical protein
MVEVLYINIYWSIMIEKLQSGEKNHWAKTRIKTSYIIQLIIEIYEWRFDVLSQEFKGFKMLQQMLKFIPTPRAMMNELFCEPTKHNCL